MHFLIDGAAETRLAEPAPWTPAFLLTFASPFPASCLQLRHRLRPHRLRCTDGGGRLLRRLVLSVYRCKHSCDPPLGADAAAAQPRQQRGRGHLMTSGRHSDCDSWALPPVSHSTHHLTVACKSQCSKQVLRWAYSHVAGASRWQGQTGSQHGRELQPQCQHTRRRAQAI